MSLIQVYSEISDKERNTFNRTLSSSLGVKQKCHKSSYDDTWLIKMEDTIKYIDNILRNPNRFIVNEEEIVKIELARRITVDSIKHLSRNTNFIQEYDPKTGEVRPSKILNINKEESFNTYENRFIYTLINNMKMYIERKKSEDIQSGNSENNISFSYQGSSKAYGEKIETQVFLSSSYKSESKALDLLSRIESVEEKVKILCSNEIYKNLAKLHVAPVTSPIKKTNLILKNVNFQYALDLWNYMQANMDASVKNVNNNKNYNDNGKLKELMDESFILNYKIMKSLEEDDNKEINDEVQKNIVSNALSQLMSIKDSLTLDDIVKLVGDEFLKVKYKRVVDTSDISRKYKEAINEYVSKDHSLKVVNDGKK